MMEVITIDYLKTLCLLPLFLHCCTFVESTLGTNEDISMNFTNTDVILNNSTNKPEMHFDEKVSRDRIDPMMYNSFPSYNIQRTSVKVEVASSDQHLSSISVSQTKLAIELAFNEMKSVITNRTPLQKNMFMEQFAKRREGRQYENKDRIFPRLGKSRLKREAQQSNNRHGNTTSNTQEVSSSPLKPVSKTLTIVKPVLNGKGLTRTTTFRRTVRRQHDAPQSSPLVRCRTSYSKWSAWLKCSARDCNRAGKQIRTRSCFANSLLAADYEKCSYKHLVENRSCKPAFCANKKSSPTGRWSEWSKCSISCGYGGQQTRKKFCYQLKQGGSSKPTICGGISIQRRSCRYSVSCPSWDSWNLWSSCSKTCGEDGVAYRSRKCIVQRYITFGNAKTDGSQFDTESDHRKSMEAPNVVNKNAVRSSQRSPSLKPIRRGMLFRMADGSDVYIVDAPLSEQDMSSKLPVPKFHQRNPFTENVDIISCLGNGGQNEQERKCSRRACPASWGRWATWSSCTNSCGMGISRRQRVCNGLKTGGSCIGKKFAYRRCYTPPCWNSWSSWTDCSGSCGRSDGLRERSRRCFGKTFIIPQYTKCLGDAIELSKCQTEACHGEKWGNWGPLGECDVSCNGGYRNRTRLCQTPTCSGPSQDFKRCNEHPCPSWTQWTLFSCCSVTCGEGTRRRSRICLSGDSQTTGCEGDSLDHASCYKLACNASLKTSPFSGFRCGEGSASNLKSIPRLRIFGGTKSAAHDWPWQLSWQHRETSTSDWMHFCGATLIHPRWVVTASHCTEESDFVVNHRNPGDNWAVVVGMVTLYRDGTRYFVDRIFVHPKYEYKSVTKNDIALIKLRKMVPITNTVMPACMPRKVRPKPGSECYVTGWGYTSAGVKASLSLSLREAAVPILKFGQCRNLGVYYQFFLDSSIHMCAGNPISASSDSCTGDSGGPLVCQRNKHWYIGAVTSFGFDDCGTPGHVGIYAPMDTYEPWIQAKIKFHTYDIC